MTNKATLIKIPNEEKKIKKTFVGSGCSVDKIIITFRINAIPYGYIGKMYVY